MKKTDKGIISYFLRSSVFGGQVIAELNSSGTWIKGYVYDGGGNFLAFQKDNTVYWVHQDPITKSKRLTDTSGNVISTVEVTPFGDDTGSFSNNRWVQRRMYTTYERDGNASDEAHHRRYNRYYGRFDQPDPYDGSYDLSDPQSFNRYSYTQNDPVNFVDPSGLNMAGPTTRYADLIGLSARSGPDLAADIVGEFGVFGYQFGGSSVVINTYLVGVESSYFLGSRQVDMRGAVPLSGETLARYQSARDRLIQLLNDPGSDCSKLLKDMLGLNGSRVARAVRGQRAFDAHASTITMGKAGLSPQRSRVGKQTVQAFFNENPALAAAAVYATPDDGGARLTDVYYTPLGLTPATILHEALHSFLGGNLTDRQLAQKLGVKDEAFDKFGSSIISVALTMGGCM